MVTKYHFSTQKSWQSSIVLHQSGQRWVRNGQIFSDKSWFHLTLDTNKFDFSNNHFVHFSIWQVSITSFIFCKKKNVWQKSYCPHVCQLSLRHMFDGKKEMGTEPLWHDVVIRHWVKMYFTVQCTHPRTSRNVPHALAHAPWFLGDRTCTCTRTRTFHYYLCYISATYFSSQKIHLAKKDFQMCIFILKSQERTF